MPGGTEIIFNQDIGTDLLDLESKSIAITPETDLANIASRADLLVGNPALNGYDALVVDMVNVMNNFVALAQSDSEKVRTIYTNYCNAETTSEGIIGN